MEKVILVTGGTGYLGSWVVQKLLSKGYSVRVPVRNKQNKDKYSHLLELAKDYPDKLSLFEADLLSSGSFDDAAEGAHAIIHMASPFTLRFKDAEKDLILPAVNGTRNVLNAASKSSTVKKVVLTSSVAAVHGDNIDLKNLGVDEFTEEHFNFSSSAKHQPYSFSKVMAEKEAWTLHNQQKRWKMVVINPSLVMGPSISKQSNSESLKIMEDLIAGKFSFGAPDLQFGFVDVRDVADAHILALENDNAEGRHILVSRVANFIELANTIEENFPQKFKLPRKTSPKVLMYLVGWIFGLSPKFISRNVGHSLKFNNTKSVNNLGLKYTSLETTIRDMVNQMVPS